MNRIVKPIETLVYYDRPELFVAVDQLNTKYLCILVEIAERYDLFLCVPISSQRLALFCEGSLDLRLIYETPETQEWFRAEINSQTNEGIPLQPIQQDNISENWLPDTGFFLEQEPLPDNLLIKEAQERKRAIIHFSLNPPEAKEETKIKASHLTESVKIFQALLKYAFKKSISNLKIETKKLLGSTENYDFEVFAFSPGSFTLHLQSTVLADLTGYAEISRALRKIDDITQFINDPEKSIEILKENRGHLINTYRRLLELIIKEDSPMSYEWTMPEIRRTIYRKINKEEALPMYELLLAREELTSEQKVLKGVVLKVDVENRTWTILSEEDDKKYSGKCDPKSTVHLGGITVETQRYEFICEESLEEETISGKEITHLILKAYKTL